MTTSTRQPPAPSSAGERRYPRRRLLGSLLLASLLLAPPAAATAAAEEDADGPTTAFDPDLEELARHVDDTVETAMAEHEAPGGVFVLVADGRIAIARGFGQTALLDGTPVDPTRTRFDVGSVAKLVTTTAVMQQVERGTLDLDEDVNAHLAAFDIPATYPQPITLAHLLTHTAGFAEHLLVGMWADTPDEVEPLAETLARHRPARTRPPGVQHQYNNYGMALAGHLVETVTDRSFEDYVHDHVLGPLGMTRTTYGRPPAEDAVDVLPHSSMAGPTAAVDPAYVNWLPAGGLWTTGEDMAAFMLAHLQGGEHEGARILEPATVAAMHRTQFSPHPAVPGLGYGFFTDQHGGIQHGGGWMGTGAHVYLRPDLGIGMFSAFNHDEGPLLASRLHRDLVERFLPGANPPAMELDIARPAAASTPVGPYTGQYRWNRHDHSSFASLLSTLQITRLRVTGHPDGTVSTTMTPAPFIDDTRWLPNGAGVFVEDGGSNVLAFDLDEDGRAVGLHVMGAQLFSMERVGWFGSAGAIPLLLLVVSVALAIAAVGWPVGALVRRLRRTGSSPAAIELRRVRRLSGAAAALGVGFLLGLVTYLAIDMTGFFQVGAPLRVLLWLPLLATILTVALTLSVVGLWRRRDGSLTARVYHSAVLVAMVGLLPLLHTLRLLGFHY
jgi:CubicO group peptidase (beta-lactamase class C family)